MSVSWKSLESKLKLQPGNPKRDRRQITYRLKPHRFNYVSVQTCVCAYMCVCVHVFDIFSDCVSTSGVPLEWWCHNSITGNFTTTWWSQARNRTHSFHSVSNRWWQSQGGEDSTRSDWPSQQGGFWNGAWAEWWAVYVHVYVGGSFIGRPPRFVHPTCCRANVQKNVLSIRVALFLALWVRLRAARIYQRIYKIPGFKDWQVLVTAKL